MGRQSVYINLWLALMLLTLRTADLDIVIKSTNDPITDDKHTSDKWYKDVGIFLDDSFVFFHDGFLMIGSLKLVRRWGLDVSNLECLEFSSSKWLLRSKNAFFIGALNFNQNKSFTSTNQP